MKKYQQYKISVTRLATKYIFIINLFKNINVNIIYYKLSQNYDNLTDTDLIIAFSPGRSEDVVCCEPNCPVAIHTCQR
jgi:hypothetical protein